jgi:hypothetical protein
MSEQMKKEFEAFAARWRYDLSENENGFYENATTQRVFDSFAWAWQASRQSLVVEMPELYETPSNGNVYFPEEITDALDVAGVKYE